MPDVRLIADISTGRLLGRDGHRVWMIWEGRTSRSVAEFQPIALMPLLERSWNDLAAQLQEDDANSFRDEVAPRVLAFALEWPTDYWIERALAWLEAEPRLAEYVYSNFGPSRGRNARRWAFIVFVRAVAATSAESAKRKLPHEVSLLALWALVYLWWLLTGRGPWSRLGLSAAPVAPRGLPNGAFRRARDKRFPARQDAI